MVSKALHNIARSRIGKNTEKNRVAEYSDMLILTQN